MSEEEVIQFISACWNKFGEHTATLVSAEQADIELFLARLKDDLDELRGNTKTLQATIAEQGAEIAGLRDALGQVYNEAEDRAVVYEAKIARLKSNEKKAFWFGFERAVTNPSRNNIQTQWSDYKALTAINPIGDAK